jgi:hypothetical protein
MVCEAWAFGSVVRLRGILDRLKVCSTRWTMALLKSDCCWVVGWPPKSLRRSELLLDAQAEGVFAVRFDASGKGAEPRLRKAS